MIGLSLMAMYPALIVGHLLGDYPLQGDFLARAKNHRAPVAGVPWWIALLSHAGIQAGIVWIITGSEFCAWAELVAHVAIDYAKSSGDLASDASVAFVVDQVLHIGCKGLWVVVLLFLALPR